MILPQLRLSSNRRVPTVLQCTEKLAVLLPCRPLTVTYTKLQALLLSSVLNAECSLSFSFHMLYMLHNNYIGGTGKRAWINELMYRSVKLLTDRLARRPRRLRRCWSRRPPRLPRWSARWLR